MSNARSNVSDQRAASTNLARRLPRALLTAIALPLAAFVVQSLLWSTLISPFAWFLFYPAIFMSSWLGGFSGGIAATLISAALVWWRFVPPEQTLVKDPKYLLAAGVFIAMGLAFTVFHERLRRANRSVGAALAASLRANELLTRAMDERRIFTALIDNSSDFIGIADPEGRPVYVNPAGRRMVGLGPDLRIESTRIEDYYPPELRRFASEVILGSMIERGHWKGETRFRHWQTEEAIPVSDEHFMIREPETERLLGVGTITRDISDIKRAREESEAANRKLQQANDEIREREERLELALRGADLAAWDWNIETGEVIFNPRWAEMRGLRPEEIRPHVDTWMAGIHRDDLPGVQKTLTDYFEGLISEYETEHRVATKSGGWIWILDRGRVFARDERGRPTRMVGTELDITVRKRLEEELRLSEAKASGLVAVSADAIISIDADQRITLFNEGAEKIFGHSRAELIGAPLDILIPERLRAIHRRHVERFAAGQEVARRMGERGAVIVGLRRNGEEFPADAAISKLDVDGNRILTVALRDVTDQKRAEEEQRFLAEAAEVLASTLDYDETLTNVARLAVREIADLCIVDIVEEDGEVRRLKVACKDPSKEWACDRLREIPLDRARPHLVWSALETKRTSLAQRLSPDAIAAFSQGEEHLRLLRAVDPKCVIAVPFVAYGEVLGVIAFVSSRPARVYGPADVRMAEELAQRAAVAIENARHYRAAQRAIQARDDVLGIVAHDLRNPLTNIIMQAQILRRRGAEAGRPSSNPAEVIERAATRMNRLIQDLLDVVRMEAGCLSVERASVSAAQVVSDSVEAQRGLASSASLAIQLDLAPGLPEVWADRDRLLQVNENLIGNAVKFTGPGGRITVGAAPRGSEALFWVADTGAGIDAEDLPHVFDRFWQARKAGRRGAGLGLPIVKGIIEAHGGRIWVESTPGRGSTFFYTIPTAPRSARTS